MEGRGSLQQMVDRSAFNDLSSDVSPMGQDRDLQVSDLTCGAGKRETVDCRGRL